MSKKYSLNERCEMLENAIDKMIEDASTKKLKVTIELAGFCYGSYFQYGGHIPTMEKQQRAAYPFKSVQTKRVFARIARLAQKFKVPALRYFDDYGNPKLAARPYMKSLAIKA